MKQKFKNSILGLAIAATTAFGAVQPVKAVELDKGLNIEALGYVDFLAVSGDHYQSGANVTAAAADTAAGRDNGFHFTRAYITAKDKLSDELMVRITYDEKDGYGGKAFVKYVYGDYSYFEGQKVRFGLGHTPWVDYEEGLYTYRFLGKILSDDQGAQSSSDIGVSLIGSFMDKMLDYHVGVYEGEGYSGTADGQGFAYAGRVSFNMQGFTVALFDWMETKRKDASGCNGGCPDYNPTRFIGMITYGNPMFRVAGQYLTADDNKSGSNVAANALVHGTFNKGNGYSLWAYSRIPGIDALRVVGRYDSMKPDTDIDTNSKTLAELGFSYDLSKSVIIALDDTIKTQKVNAAGDSLTDNLLGIKAQVAF
jgi:hypothetical protein